MINNWQQVKVSELCDLIVDCINKTAPITKEKTAFKMIRTPNIRNGVVNLDWCRSVSSETYDKWTRRAKVNKWDVLLTREAPMGEVGLIDFQDTVFLGQRIMQYRANPEKVDSNFLLYSFLSTNLQKQFNRHSNTGSIVSHIKVKDCLEFDVFTPPLDEQKKIAKVLANLDQKIKLNNKINLELEKISKDLYDYWFVQFDFPNEDWKPYKSSEGKTVWSEELKREIPEGWEVKKIGELGEFKNGINYDPSIEGNVDAKIINVRNISSSNLFVSKYELDTISLEKNNVQKYLVTEQDILIARSGIPGATRMMFDFEENTIYCGFIIRFQVNILIQKRYLFYCLKDLEKIMTSKSGGTIMPNVNQDSLKRMNILLPNKDIIFKFNNIINPIFGQMNNITNENKQLEELRDLLLPMLMNGQVSVK